MNSDSTFSFDEINVETNEVISSNNVNGDVTFAAINNPSNGFISGTFTLDGESADTNKLICTSLNKTYSQVIKTLYSVSVKAQKMTKTQCLMSY